MAVYICASCDQYIDEDVGGCNEHPTDECECICDNCVRDCDDYDDDEPMDLEDTFELLMNQ